MDLSLSPGAWPIARAASHGVTCILLAACVFSSACATVINGSIQRVAIASDPPGAQVYVNDAPAGVTPAFVDVPRRDPDLKLRLEKDGYEPTLFPLERSRSGWLWGNLLFPGVPVNEVTVEMWIGAVVVYGVLGSLWDVRSGGAWKRPDLVRATLDPIRGANHTAVDEKREPSLLASVIRAPGAGAPKPRNRLVPMRLAERVQRLTDRRLGCGPGPGRRLNLARP